MKLYSNKIIPFEQVAKDLNITLFEATVLRDYTIESVKALLNMSIGLLTNLHLERDQYAAVRRVFDRLQNQKTPVEEYLCL